MRDGGERKKGAIRGEGKWERGVQGRRGGQRGGLIQSSFVLLRCGGQLTVPSQCETIQMSPLCLTAVSLHSSATSSQSLKICVRAHEANSFVCR